MNNIRRMVSRKVMASAESVYLDRIRNSGFLADFVKEMKGTSQEARNFEDQLNSMTLDTLKEMFPESELAEYEGAR